MLFVEQLTKHFSYYLFNSNFNVIFKLLYSVKQNLTVNLKLDSTAVKVCDLDLAKVNFKIILIEFHIFNYYFY